MNTKIFNSIVKNQGLPSQQSVEWKMFLEFCSVHLKARKVKNPVVVELGTLHNKQKQFYEQLFGAEYIGIDISEEREKPDICGDTRNPKVLAKLMQKLDGRPIDILFIDASHRYKNVVANFETYSPLCNGIVAFSGIDRFRNKERKSSQVWKFWDEIKLGTHKGAAEYRYYPLISIFKRRIRGRSMGIGMMVKE